MTAEAVIQICKEKGLTLTTTESLTGGLLAARLTDVPGASAVLKQGFITYCNRAKNEILHVQASTLEKYGAVSEETAREMAKNGSEITNSDICISLTGNAGPTAEEGKPVGLVYIACACDGKVKVREHHFEGDRSQVRESAVEAALMMLKECIGKE